MSIQPSERHPASFRDPSGFIFTRDGIIYRQVNQGYRNAYELFLSSGCYADLVAKNQIIPHTVSEIKPHTEDGWSVIRPEQIDFVSYPYEWSFSMLRDATLLTLEVMRTSLAHGMILKDASPYNIQWHEGKLIFIDTLSFEKYNEELPWVAYRQFCESFLAPLLLMRYAKSQLHQLLLSWPDGIPLEVCAALLPKRSRFNLHAYLHIHLHAQYSRKSTGRKDRKVNFSRTKMTNLLSSLKSIVKKCSVPDRNSTWSNYYEGVSLRNDYLDQKKQLINGWLDQMTGVRTAIDVGANEGEFSYLLAVRGIRTVSADFDPYCIGRLYDRLQITPDKNIQPLILDLANPSPGNGVNYAERSSFTTRADRDLVLALAVIHHLAIGKHLSLKSIAKLLRGIGQQLIIEFVPPDDPLVIGMLARKTRTFEDYTEANFQEAFGEFYELTLKTAIPGSGRVLYLFNGRTA